jgi:hypothetical protein
VPSLDGLRQPHGDKVLLRVQIVVTGFVDNANLMMLQAGFVWKGLINLAQLQGGSVTLVADADDEMNFALHVSLECA